MQYLHNVIILLEFSHDRIPLDYFKVFSLKISIGNHMNSSAIWEIIA